MTPARERSRSTMVVVLLLAVAAIAGGCGQKESASPAEAPPAAQPPAQPAAAGPAEPAPAMTPVSGSAGPSPAAAAAPAGGTAAPSPLVQEHEAGVEVTLVEARRTAGDSLTVKWRYRNTQTADVKILKGGSAWSEVYKLTMGAFLIDPVNKKKYMVITDAENIPLASKHGDWQGYTLAPGQTLSSWAKFPAPPSDVLTMTVTLPGVPPFEDVPIVK